jgi:cytoskeletal protein CcmA (bactofilin family)
MNENVPIQRSDQQSEHLDEMTLMLYVEGLLDRHRAQEVSAHTQDCAQCRTLLRALDRESRLLTRAMLEEDEPLPSRLAAFQQRVHNSMQWIWGVVFGLAATGAYTLYTQYVEPMQSRFEQAGFGGSSLLNLVIFQGAFWKGWQSMATLIEVLALVTILASTAMFIRRRVRRGSAYAMIAGLFAASSLSPALYATTEFRHTDTVEVAKGDTVKGDLYASGREIRIEGTVDGDLFIFGQEANVDGHVTGDVIAFAQELHINGQVDGNVRSFANSVYINGTVAKNAMAFAEHVTVDSAGKIGGSITTFVQALTLDGHVGRDVLALTDSTNISGKVDGAITAQGTNLRLKAGSQVGGAIKFKGEHEPEVDSAAKLESRPEFTQNEHHADHSTGGSYVWKAIWAAAVIIYGLVLFLLLPRFANDSVDAGHRYGASFGLGVLVLFAVPVVAVIACITVVGLLVGISAFAVWLAAINAAHAVVGAIIGMWMMGQTRDNWQLIGRMVVGVLALRVVELVPILGGWVKFAVVLWGLGAIALAIYRRFAPANLGYVPPVPSGPSAPLPPNTYIGTPQSA